MFQFPVPSTSPLSPLLCSYLAFHLHLFPFYIFFLPLPWFNSSWLSTLYAPVSSCYTFTCPSLLLHFLSLHIYSFHRLLYASFLLPRAYISSVIFFIALVCFFTFLPYLVLFSLLFFPFINFSCFLPLPSPLYIFP